MDRLLRAPYEARGGDRLAVPAESSSPSSPGEERFAQPARQADGLLPLPNARARKGTGATAVYRKPRPSPPEPVTRRAWRERTKQANRLSWLARMRTSAGAAGAASAYEPSRAPGRDADPSQDVSDAVQALLESLPPLNPQDPRFWGDDQFTPASETRQ